ncbi:hypothetical protein ALC60_13319 [Trachymyrmex zeteki]|uniref:DDE Tnp4 domain-containing protein n=1 Tax=Mycetomoellerius zeteki TaxID=64791 RepID=A0A151WIA7_9HYME|nr:hypothetical protein ALC60_13318 [Trachymyrmex zeteki]KYQ47564.1 hypothetical protein ALC60_13319 [Trachymyrmex zeteki]
MCQASISPAMSCCCPGVIGDVDGTHVAICPSEKEREHLYINRKLYYSLNILHYSSEFSVLIANACCVLHNVAKFYNVPEVY